MRKEKTILVKEEVQIGNVILEAGDKIKVLKEDFPNFRDSILDKAKELVNFYGEAGANRAGAELARIIFSSLEGENSFYEEASVEFNGAFLNEMSRLG